MKESLCLEVLKDGHAYWSVANQIYTDFSFVSGPRHMDSYMNSTLH